ncbi:MAG: entericidin A/B family lipoprotein [Desulfamplus sp.]
MKKIIITVAAVFLFCVSIQGCNTVKGVGKDIQKTGEVIQKSVN